jgi:hypothetical protein
MFLLILLSQIFVLTNFVNLFIRKEFLLDFINLKNTFDEIYYKMDLYDFKKGIEGV